MFWIIYGLLFAGVIFFTLRMSKRMREGRKYNYRKDMAPYYFENGDLVLNGFGPQYAPVAGIDHVEFIYEIWELEKSLKYEFSMKIVNKDGSQTKESYFRSYAYGGRVLKPADMAADLEKQGIRCTLPYGKSSALRGNYEMKQDQNNE